MPTPEKAEILLWLAHVRVEVVEVSQFCSPESRVGICGIEALVMLNVYEDIVLPSSFEQLLVVFEELDSWFRDEHVNAALYGIEGNWIVGCVWGEDGDCAAFWEGVNGLLVCIWVGFSLLGVLVE